MTYLFNNPNDYTSKSRLKVSPYQTIFFNTFQYGKETDVWDEYTTGTATATHTSSTNSVAMYVDGASGSTVIRQTTNVMRYIPGRASTLSFAIRLQTPVTGIRRRFGLFGTDDGFYFEDAGVVGADGQPQYNVVVRSSTSGSVQEVRVPRSQWNGDKLDGTGASGIVADPTAQQLVEMEYEWYGVGQIKFSFVIDGKPRTIHTFNHGNRIPAPWCSTPFLPIRLELSNINGVTGDHYMYQGSNSLITEGETEKTGSPANIQSPIAGTKMTNADVYYPVLSIRLKPGALRGVVVPTNFQVATIDNTNVFYKIVHNATLGTGGGTWTDHPDPDAFTQYQIYTNPSSPPLTSQGVSIVSGFVIAGNSGVVKLDDQAEYQIGRRNMGTTSDVLTIMVASSNAAKDALAALTWIEQR